MYEVKVYGRNDKILWNKTFDLPAEAEIAVDEMFLRNLVFFNTEDNLGRTIGIPASTVVFIDIIKKKEYFNG